MNRPSSSTFSSDNGSSWERTFRVVGWTFLFLVIFDIGVSVLFAYPSDPKNLRPNQLELYFDYGRSMESRLRRASRADPDKTAPITLAGWYSPLIAGSRPAKPRARTVTLYGNSQTVRLADALQRNAPGYTARTVAAPGSTANWAYGAYLRDSREAQGDAVVLTIMASNLPMIRSMSAMTWNTSFAMPYTADVFEIEHNRLVRHKPPYESFRGYIAALASEEQWREAKETFALHDPFYDRFLFERSISDHSTIALLIRRGWGQRRDARIRARSLNRDGFDPTDPAILVANAIIVQFAQRAKSEGLVPILYIVNNRGYGDTMYRALARTLAEQRIPFVATNQLVDSNDPRNFLSDGHFTDANDRRFAKALEAVLDQELRDSSEQSDQAMLGRAID